MGVELSQDCDIGCCNDSVRLLTARVFLLEFFPVRVRICVDQKAAKPKTEPIEMILSSVIDASKASRSLSRFVLERQRRERVLTRVAAAFAALIAVAAFASPIGYSVRSDTSGKELYRINLATGAASIIGASGFSKIEALALSANDELYGVNPQSAQLVRCSTSTGACTAVGTLSGIPPASTNAGLTFDSTGRLFLSMNAVLYSVDPASASATAIGASGAAISGLASTAPTPACTSGLFGIGGNSDQGKFYCLNTTTGAATQLSTLSGATALDGGLDADRRTGLIWGLTNESPGKIYTVDPSTFAVSNVVTVTVSGVATGGFESLAVARSSEPTNQIPAAPIGYLLGLFGVIAVWGSRALLRRQPR
jgi:hypothetical protein